MTFKPFELERLLSDWEQTVEFNFAESGVHPVMLKEVLNFANVDFEQFIEIPLNYPEVNGDVQLRERVAALYEGASPDNVLVTVGASEANYILANTLLESGDEVAVMRPTYMQLSGAAANLGANVRSFSLDGTKDWALDLDELKDAVTPKTKVIAVVNPNNPTGKILSDIEMDAIITIAEKVGAWLITDEVYSGSERDIDQPAISFYGKYDKVIVVNGLSKAYGLPGLRIGWVVAPSFITKELWKRHEFTTISSSMLGNRLGEMALRPNVRKKLLTRAQKLTGEGFATPQYFLDEHPDVFSVVPPMASALSFVRYKLPINSTELVHKIRKEKSVLIVPGNCFDLDHHLRISSALPKEYLKEGLGRMNEVVRELLS
jgi:aspartate/methionine/tyrosine aminotransferase